MKNYHFISGLPRSGSTLLSTLLRQNPAVHAGMSGPVFDLVGNVTETIEVIARYDVEVREDFDNQTASFKVRWAF